ncbi:Uncharacterised protein [Vibrio cholerae]|nr:Uncharacterised protein [Vibrio cholerae]CSD34636.1 Uncharacterised protein [Vibrio cholerae]CSI30666.1 Uncharacterised protein [Vibrio cholerae]CSI84733.1 Uncharacterised protein [Vibrio cholerae]
MLFGATNQLFDWRNARQHFLATFANRGVETARQHLRQMVVQCADIL